jgi:hypothetical protein
MVHGRRSFGSVEQRSGYFRARYVGPDQGRYEAPHAFVSKIDAEYWLAEIHREIVREEWRPPQKDVEADPKSVRSPVTPSAAWRIATSPLGRARSTTSSSST